MIYARMCLLGVSMMNNHIYGPKVSQNSHFGGLNMYFKRNMQKNQIAISSDLCIKLTWNLTGSGGQQQRLRGWPPTYGGKTIPRWRTAAILKIVISPYLSEQELSYRKQIGRQLSTQYVDGIYRSNYPWPWNLGQGSLNQLRSLETEPLDRSYTTYY